MTTQNKFQTTAKGIQKQQVMALLQQRAQVAQGVLYQLIAKHGSAKCPANIAKYAVMVADAFMDEIYGKSEE